jgi:flagellar biosynthesis protein FliP
VPQVVVTVMPLSALLTALTTALTVSVIRLRLVSVAMSLPRPPSTKVHAFQILAALLVSS